VEYRHRNPAIRVSDEDPPGGAAAPAHLPPATEPLPPQPPIGHRFLRSPGDSASIIVETGTYRPKAGSHAYTPSITLSAVSRPADMTLRPTATGRRPPPARWASRGPCGRVAGVSPEPRGVCSRGPSRPVASLAVSDVFDPAGGEEAARVTDKTSAVRRITLRCPRSAIPVAPYALVGSLATPQTCGECSPFQVVARKPPPRPWPA